MFDTFFKKYPDYHIVQKPTKEVIYLFKDKLPSQIINFWLSYGIGVFMDGYLKVVNPSMFQPLLDGAYVGVSAKLVLRHFW